MIKSKTVYILECDRCRATFVSYLKDYMFDSASEVE